MIELRNVWFKYEPAKVLALRGVSLKIKKGEVIGIIGQNGSGKTTLVKQFNGLLRPTRGKVLINNKDVIKKTVAEISRIVGYVFQNPDDQIFSKTIKDEVSFGPNNLGFPNKIVKQSVRDALKRVKLFNVRKNHPYDVSYNKRKLITIASILSMDPEVIILDEPTTGQDSEGRLLVQSIVKELRKKEKTVIVISHDMEFIAETTDRVIVMKEGKILMDSNTESIYSKPEILKLTYLKPPQITRLCQRISWLPNNILKVEDCYKLVKGGKNA